MTTEAARAGVTEPSTAALLTEEIRFGRADLHVQTIRGEDASNARSIFDRIERRDELDVVVIAARDCIEGTLDARKVHAANDYGFEFVSGLVVTSADGPVLGLWIDEPIASGGSLAETVAAIHAMDGVTVVPHPLAWLMRSVGRIALERVLAGHERASCPDAIQVASGSSREAAGSRKALELNAMHWHLPEVGASGAVFEERVASAYTLFPGTLRPGARAVELRGAITAGTTVAVAGPRVPLRRMGIRRVVEQRGRELRFGWGRTVGPVLQPFMRHRPDGGSGAGDSDTRGVGSSGESR
jgi:predicted metal-dependent phosphoesterase TrpH